MEVPALGNIFKRDNGIDTTQPWLESKKPKGFENATVTATISRLIVVASTEATGTLDRSLPDLLSFGGCSPGGNQADVVLISILRRRWLG